MDSKEGILIFKEKEKTKRQAFGRKIKKFIYFCFLIIIIRKQKSIIESFENNSKISIILPTYNREKFISNTIKSCLQQTYNPIEIIVIDDCSTDNTKEVIKDFKDIRIKYIKLLTHKGASYSRNIGIKKAKGSYITFIDSDDVFLPEKLKIQFQNLIKINSDLDFCKIKRIEGVQKQDVVPNSRQIKVIKNGNIYNELLSNGNFISTQAILVKKKYIKKYLFDENIPRLQDYELLLRMLPSIKVSFTNQILVNSYLQNNSISYSNSNLINAIKLLLNKNYSLNLQQKQIFSKYLNKILNIVIQN